MSGVWSHGKGDRRRPACVGEEERRLREALFYGFISFAQFEDRYRQLRAAGKITRNGRRVR